MLKREIKQPEWVAKNRSDALSIKEKLLHESERRLNALKNQVAEVEKANRLKNLDLIKREQKIEDELAFIAREREALEKAHRQHTAKQSKISVLTTPILLGSCVLAAYFSFSQLNADQFNQAQEKSNTIAQLSRVLKISETTIMKHTNTIAQYEQSVERAMQELSILESSITQKQSSVETQREVQSGLDTLIDEQQDLSHLTAQENNIFKRIENVKALLSGIER